jgi:hypothetical protein
LSDPTLDPSKVAIANFSSLKPYHEKTCIIEPGEHSCIPKRTCIPYRFAYLLTLAYLEDGEADGSVERRESLSPELLSRALSGAAQSVFMPTEVWDVIENQGLVDPF